MKTYEDRKTAFMKTHTFNNYSINFLPDDEHRVFILNPSRVVSALLYPRQYFITYKVSTRNSSFAFGYIVTFAEYNKINFIKPDDVGTQFDYTNDKSALAYQKSDGMLGTDIVTVNELRATSITYLYTLEEILKLSELFRLPYPFMI